jgi:hypothetical protein
MSVPASTAIKLQAAACAGGAVVCLAHLEYLRALQRKGRDMLARTAPEELSPCRCDDVGSLDVR